MKTIHIILTILWFMLVSCQAATPDASLIQTAIAQTQAALPTKTIQPSSSPVPTVTPLSTVTSAPSATPTVIPLIELDLEPILVKPGDLPAGFSAAQISNILPGMFSRGIQSEKSFYLQFSRNNAPAGGVAVMLFEKFPNNINIAYDLIGSELMDKYSAIPGLGQKALIFSYETSLGLKATEVLFAECQALVHVRFVGTNDDRVSTTYAKRLDERLKTLVCRNKN